MVAADLVVSAVGVVAADLAGLAAGVQAAAGPVAAGSGAPGRPRPAGRARNPSLHLLEIERRGMVPEKLINEFVERMRAAAGTNLLAAILYGSAAAGDYVADHSDVNLLCLLGETSFAEIAALAPAIAWWEKQKHRPPLLMSAE